MNNKAILLKIRICLFFGFSVYVIYVKQMYQDTKYLEWRKAGSSDTFFLMVTHIACPYQIIILLMFSINSRQKDRQTNTNIFILASLIKIYYHI